MLLRRRTPAIDNRPPDPAEGFEHLQGGWIAVLRWLQTNRVEFVLVGAVAEAVRGRTGVRGPVAIVPAPYGRNFARLACALEAAQACVRVDGSAANGGSDTAPVKVTADKLARGHRWTLRCGHHELDVEEQAGGSPRYQELLYESNRFEVAEEVVVEVASPEDIEHYAHLRRTGSVPEIKITRTAAVEQETT